MPPTTRTTPRRGAGASSSLHARRVHVAVCISSLAPPKKRRTCGGAGPSSAQDSGAPHFYFAAPDRQHLSHVGRKIATMSTRHARPQPPLVRTSCHTDVGRDFARCKIQPMTQVTRPRGAGASSQPPAYTVGVVCDVPSRTPPKQRTMCGVVDSAVVQDIDAPHSGFVLPGRSFLFRRERTRSTTSTLRRRPRPLRAQTPCRKVAVHASVLGIVQPTTPLTRRRGACVTSTQPAVLVRVDCGAWMRDLPRQRKICGGIDC